MGLIVWKQLISTTLSGVSLGSTVGCASNWWSGGCMFDPSRVGNILSLTWIRKYFLRSFSPFTWFKKIRKLLSVSGKRVCTILFNHLGDKACSVNVWLGKLNALHMTQMGWLGRKSSTQTNIILSVISADDKLMIFFLFFPENKHWHIMSIMKCRNLFFWGKYSKCRLLKFLPGILCVKTHIPLRNSLMTLLVKYTDNKSYICGVLWLSNR